MELYFLALLILLMAGALASGYPVAFALPGSAILSIVIAAGFGYVFAGDVDAYFAQGGPSQWVSAGITNLRGVYWEVERDTLIAIPLFIFMGIMLQRSKIAEDLLITMAQLFGPVRGGLGISVVFVGALLAATTGILGATVVAMGLISLPAMLRNNYSPSLASGTIAASGTLGQIIPPSIVLIILADQLASAVDQAGTQRELLYKQATGEISMPSEFGVVSTSAGEMFLGAFVPGLVLVGLYMVYVLIRAYVQPSSAPAVARGEALSPAFVLRVAVILVPPLGLIFLVLGSIIAGIATVNQAGAIGAAGATLMAGYRLKRGEPGALYPGILAIVSLVGIGLALSSYEMNIKNVSTKEDARGIFFGVVAVTGLIIALIWSGLRVLRIDNTLQGVMVQTAKTTSLVFIILLGAAMLTAAFRAFGGEEIVKDFLNSLPGGFWTQFVIVMAVIFFLGFFLDFIEIAVVVVPIVAPILLADPSANITAVWLGVMIGLNVQTSFLTPPFGFALFYLRGVAPAIVRTLDIYKGVAPFITLQLVGLAIVGYYPSLVNYLPNRASFTSETAPPPRNPKLQYCLENYVTERFVTDEERIRDAVVVAAKLDLSYLPKKIAKEMSASFEVASSGSTLLDEARVAEAEVLSAAPAYRPLHRQVRRIEANIRKIDTDTNALEQTVRYLRDDAPPAEKESLEKEIARLQKERVKLEQSIPAEWAERSATFGVLKKNHRDALLNYRRAVDKGYAPVASLLEILNGTESLRTMKDNLEGLRARVESEPPAQLVEVVSDLSKQIKTVSGTGDITSPLTKARRALKSKTPKVEKALEQIDKAIRAYEEQMVWRERADIELKPALMTYEQSIRDTIGARSQSKMSTEQALFVATCSSAHRDISLSF